MSRVGIELEKGVVELSEEYVFERSSRRGETLGIWGSRGGF